ncbi:hypothetical protein [Amycolatopsis saalfeldensis]|uniref:Uncharacterized protein n=1 Tax=Amycolatopsis saalfeldensis TaxID=394193 RepID=A0A1H8YGV6_9PSEU|nr:hypothetical protein [Amycolatopsis saalfeldensis]SEP51444.1 hypothetical protein SAMN04489732_11638 [Amycolatopsis saalfeldensis]
MQFDNALAVALTCGVFGLVILIVLWPGERQGTRLLTKWGLPEATPDQVSTAVRYLRRRRFWYPWLFIGLPLIPHAGDLQDSNGGGAIVVTLLVGALIAELFAQRPARTARREATLTTRRMVDFVPPWALVVNLLAMLAAVAHLALLGQWTMFGITLAADAAAWLVAMLAVRRPAEGDPVVDLALRCRSARVAIGLGAGLCAMTGWTAGNLSSLVAFVVTVAAFRAIAAPPGKLPATAAAK